MILYWAKVVALLALVVFLSFGSYFFLVTTEAEKQLDSQISATIFRLDADINTTFDLVNRDCGSGKPCGLIPNINKTVIKAGDAVVQTQIEEKKVADSIAPHTIAAMDKLGSSADNLGSTAKSLGKTSDELTKTLQIANDKDTGLPALLGNTNGAVTDFRSYIKSQAMQTMLADAQRTVHFTADTSQNIAGITNALRIQADKLNAPKTKTQQILQWAPIGVKVGITVTCAILGPC